MNGPNQNNTADYIQNILAKINYETGATIWGKQLFYSYNKSIMPISSTVLMNNVAWSLMTLDKINLSAPAVIIKVDIDGNVVEAFKALNYNLPTCFLFKEDSIACFYFIFIKKMSAILKLILILASWSEQSLLIYKESSAYLQILIKMFYCLNTTHWRIQTGSVLLIFQTEPI